MTYEEFLESWEAVNAVDPATLTETRLAAHWAAQIIGGVGEALVDPQPDFSHTSMWWSEEFRSLVGRPTKIGSRVALRLADLTIHIHAPNGTSTSTELEGRTLRQSLDWVIAELEKSERVALAGTPEIPSYEMPEHGVSKGEAFGVPDAKRLKELSRWYANASRLAEIVSHNTLGASPVRCWPHHFDIATLVTLDPDGSDPEAARSIGFGLSPGDGSYDEPYFYVNPWPSPAQRENHHPLAGGGQWHTDGWFGAVLPAGAIKGDARTQAEQVLTFAKSAMAANRIILGTL